jgi:multidrug efflux pump subunit AcrA (membrane-fusion protein)
VVDLAGDTAKPATRAVKTGVQNDQVVEITDGLQEGDQIMIQSTTTRVPSGGGGPVPGAGPNRVVFGGPGH